MILKINSTRGHTGSLLVNKIRWRLAVYFGISEENLNVHISLMSTQLISLLCIALIL